MNHFNYNILLLRRHFVIGRQTQPAPEEIRAHVHAGPGDVGVASPASAALRRHEGVAPVDGLHVHGLPDGPTFRVERGQGVENLLRAALAADALIQIVLFSADLRGHRVFIQEHAGQQKLERSFPDPRGSPERGNRPITSQRHPASHTFFVFHKIAVSSHAAQKQTVHRMMETYSQQTLHLLFGLLLSVIFVYGMRGTFLAKMVFSQRTADSQGLINMEPGRQ